MFPFAQSCAHPDPQIFLRRSQWPRLARHPSEPAAVWVSWLDSAVHSLTLSALSRARLSVQSDFTSVCLVCPGLLGLSHLKVRSRLIGSIITTIIHHSIPELRQTILIALLCPYRGTQIRQSLLPAVSLSLLQFVGEYGRAELAAECVRGCIRYLSAHYPRQERRICSFEEVSLFLCFECSCVYVGLSKAKWSQS